MERRLDGLSEKLDAFRDEVKTEFQNIAVTLARNTDGLEEHMRRTALLETELKPIRDHVQFIKTALRIVVILLPCLAAARHLNWF